MVQLSDNRNHNALRCGMRGCKDFVQRCTTTVSWNVERVPENQRVQLHHLLNDRNKGGINLTRPTKVEKGKPHIGVPNKQSLLRGHNFQQGRHNGKAGRRVEFPSKGTVFLGHRELGDRAGLNN